MLKSLISLLSTHNGPSYLLHAVETLNELEIPQRNVRIVPVIGWATGPEVEPYYAQSNLANLRKVVPDRLFVRLCINVRGDNRLQRFMPLVAAGLAPQDEVLRWKRLGETPAQGYRDLYLRLGEVDPDWTNTETPVERLTRQLCALFPKLLDPALQMEPPSDRILVVRSGQWEERINSYIGMRSERRVESDNPYQSAMELVEQFLTQGMLALASADMLGGFEYRLKVEPEGRPIDIVITRSSDAREVVKWYHAYPHYTLPEVSFPELDSREQAEWEQYFRQHPDRDNIFETAPKLWTEEDPAIVALSEEIQRQFQEGRSEEITPDEMLSFARKYLPDYVPRYPHQFAVTGGLNLEGILISLIECWLQDGPFLGVGFEDWQRFSATEQLVLCGLLMQRRQRLDQCALFEAAVRLLIDPNIETALEMYRLEPVRLGKPLAQPNRTLSLDGVAALHAPEMVLKLPLDRTRDDRAEQIEAKIKVIARLFLPVHITYKLIWQVNWAVLGRSAYLQHGDAAAREAAPVSRLPES